MCSTRTAISVMLLGLAACSRSGPPRGSSAGGDGSVEIKVTKPIRKSLVKTIEQPGTVRAEEEAPLYAKLSGYVLRYHFDIGRRVNGPKFETARDWLGRPYQRQVQAGDLLAEIYIPELEDESRQKQAVLRQAETELEQSRQLFAVAEENVVAMKSLAVEAGAGLRRAEANLNRWKSEEARIAKLVLDRTVEPQVGDETRNQLLASEAARDEANARVTTANANARRSGFERDKARADIDVAEAKLHVADAEARRLQDLLGYAQVRAPFDGVITDRRTDKGRFVEPAGSPKSQPLFTVMRVDKVRVVVLVPEADASLVRTGDEARITVPDKRNVEFVKSVARTSGALDPVSRTLRVEVDLDNKDGALEVGNFVQVRLRPKLPEHWTLPTGAIARSGERLACYRIVDGKAVYTPVRLGRGDGTSIAVLKKLKPGTADEWEDWTGDETVAAENAAYLSDGQAVKIK
jgi:RND family efflux transporter MFP subunit